jgi:3-oxoacyl-[acyl-carrier-protein] synthase II
MKKHRVVITGIGLVTPVGNDVKNSWNSIINGRSGISFFKTDKNLGYPSSVAGSVFGIEEKINKILTPSEQRKTSRFIQLSLIAAEEALKDSGLNPVNYNCDRFGAYVGVGIGGLADIESAVLNFSTRGYRSISPFVLPKLISNEAPAWISIKNNLCGPTMAIVNACSSGNDAIGQAFRAIQDGYADYMIAGGAESCLTPIALSGFGNMRALSSWKGDPAAASRPFDKNRSGFVMAEGSGILILERKDLAKKRGAKIYAEIVGYGASSDAYHITAIHPQGHGAICAIESALRQGKVNKKDIGYVNAHGTATLMNDPAETKILKKVFKVQPSVKENVPLVSSTKSMTGHMLGAAGGAEVAFTALAIKNGILPPTINLDEPDPECDLDYISGCAREKKIKYALSNSFGFGGANSVILLKSVF